MRLTAPLLLVVLLASPAHGQGADPKREFTEAIGRVAASLEGRFGDDPFRTADGLAALEQALVAWDDQIARYEAATAGDVAKSSPQDAASFRVALALSLAERGRVNDALAQLEAAIAASPRHVDAHTVLGLVYGQVTADGAAATRAFRSAVEADPAAPLQRYLLAKRLADDGALDEAAGVGLRLRTDARSPDAPDRAPFVRISVIPEVPGLEPYFPPVRYAEAFALLARGECSAGVAALKAAASGDPLLAPPEAVRADLLQAGAAFRDGETTAALAALDRVQQAAPAWSEVHRLRGLVLVAEERADEGMAAFREGLRLAPADERTHLALAEALAALERYEEADAALGSAMARVPGSARLHHARARVLQRQGSYPEALDEFARSLSLHPGLPLLGRNSVYDTVATLQRARQEFTGATAAFASRVDLVPNDVKAHRDLGDLYFRQGLDDVAWNELAMAEALAPRDVATQALLAQLHLRAGRYAEAMATARRIIRLDPGHAQAHFVLGTALVRLDQADEGARALDAFARLHAADDEANRLQLELAALRREAEVYAGQGDHARAVALLTRVVERLPASDGDRVALGAALLRAGRAAEAVDRLQEAAGLGAGGDVYRHLAEAYAALGQTDQSAGARAVYLRIRRDSLRQANRQ